MFRHRLRLKFSLRTSMSLRLSMSDSGRGESGIKVGVVMHTGNCSRDVRVCVHACAHACAHACVCVTHCELCRMRRGQFYQSCKLGGWCIFGTSTKLAHRYIHVSPNLIGVRSPWACIIVSGVRTGQFMWDLYSSSAISFIFCWCCEYRLERRMCTLLVVWFGLCCFLSSLF